MLTLLTIILTCNDKEYQFELMKYQTLGFNL